MGWLKFETRQYDSMCGAECNPSHAKESRNRAPSKVFLNSVIFQFISYLLLHSHTFIKVKNTNPWKIKALL